EAAAFGDRESRKTLAGREALAGELRARPRARDQRTVGVERPQRACGLEETGGALHDQRGQPLRVQNGGQLALDVGERGEVLPACALRREQPRILQRERGLVGEGLQQRRLAVREDASAAAAGAPTMAPLARRGTASTATALELRNPSARSADTRVASSTSASGVATARPSATARARTPTPGGST